VTIGDLLKGDETPAPATRRAIAAKLGELETAFELLFDCLSTVVVMVQDARALLADSDDDEPVVDGDDEHAEERVAEHGPATQTYSPT
jgi:hypothetical protein